jgi:hypothetical protein
MQLVTDVEGCSHTSIVPSRIEAFGQLRNPPPIRRVKSTTIVLSVRLKQAQTDPPAPALRGIDARPVPAAACHGTRHRAAAKETATRMRFMVLPPEEAVVAPAAGDTIRTDARGPQRGCTMQQQL